MAKQLMQQALDALRQCEFTSPPAQRPIVKDAITALRSALDASPATSADYAMGYAEGFNDACRPDGLVRETAIDFTVLYSFADEHRISYNKLCAAVRQALAAPAPVVREPLTDKQLAKIAVEDEFLLYCDQDEFNEIARAIELAHGIGGGGK